MSSLHNQIHEVMESFDFKQVLKVMHFLDWKWKGKTVTLQDLKDTAHQCLWEAASGYEKEGQGPYQYSVSTGGFIAEVQTFKNAAPRLSLTFYVHHTVFRPE